MSRLLEELTWVEGAELTGYMVQEGLKVIEQDLEYSELEVELKTGRKVSLYTEPETFTKCYCYYTTEHEENIAVLVCTDTLQVYR